MVAAGTKRRAGVVHPNGIRRSGAFSNRTTRRLPRPCLGVLDDLFYLEPTGGGLPPNSGSRKSRAMSRITAAVGKRRHFRNGRPVAFDDVTPTHGARHACNHVRGSSHPRRLDAMGNRRRPRKSLHYRRHSGRRQSDHAGASTCDQRHHHRTAVGSDGPRRIDDRGGLLPTGRSRPKIPACRTRRARDDDW